MWEIEWTYDRNVFLSDHDTLDSAVSRLREIMSAGVWQITVTWVDRDSFD